MTQSPPKTEWQELPLVYSCSGCSDVAQLANAMALRLDREHKAEMSCIAGVGGGVKPLVRKAQSGRQIIALDGCQLHCARHCLDQAGVTATVHIDLSQAGVKKRLHRDFCPEDAEQVWQQVVLPAVDSLEPEAPVRPESPQC